MQRNIKKIIVLGGGYAGTVAALDLARRLGESGRVVLVDARDHLVERIRLHEVAAGRDVRVHPYEELLEGTGVGFVRAKVRAIDLAQRVLTTDAGLLHYDRLFVAAGSSTAEPVPGVREHPYALASEASAYALRAALDWAALQPGAHMAIVGGGATAIELAFELVAAYPDIEVTMVSPSVGEGLSEGARRAIEDRLEEAGVERDARRVEAVTADGLSFEDGAMDFDIVVWAAGFTASSLGKDAGLAVGTQDRILVDAQLRSVSHPDVYVAGDAALPPAECGAPALMSCRLAIPMALRASENLAAGLVGAESKPLRIRDTLRCLSLGRDDGLIQLMRSDGRPRSLFITGRPAAFVKEMVVRSTISAIRHYRARARRARRRSQPTADLALPRTRPGLE